MDTTYDTRLVDDRAGWGAVLSMALCVAVLIASEFMPVSLISPIAADLSTTEGRTGRAPFFCRWRARRAWSLTIRLLSSRLLRSGVLRLDLSVPFSTRLSIRRNWRRPRFCRNGR